jgi:hypothetical protein
MFPACSESTAENNSCPYIFIEIRPCPPPVVTAPPARPKPSSKAAGGPIVKDVNRSMRHIISPLLQKTKRVHLLHASCRIVLGARLQYRIAFSVAATHER